MKRGASPQNDPNASKQAADRLRDATHLLGGAQQQLATGKVDSLSREAERLAGEERAQAGEIEKLSSESSSGGSMDAAGMNARLRERNRLAGERQDLSSSLSKLQNGVREAARGMATDQPGVAKKLRDALTEMDQADLDNHVQRTADWLRRGINPNSGGTEGQIAKGLQRLSEQLRTAQGEAGQEKPGQRGTGRGQGDQTDALNQIARLRSQVGAMASLRGDRQPGQTGQPGQAGQTGQPRPDSAGQQSGNPGKQGGAGKQGQGSRDGKAGQQGQGGQQQAQAGQQQGHAGRQGQPGQSGQQGQAGRGQGQQPGGSQSQGSTQSGEVRTGGGGAEGMVAGNINTGNNQYGQPGQRPVGSSAQNPADVERSFQQGMRELSQLRQSVQGNAQAQKDLSDLTRRMQGLDPKRFPGNPALVEQMDREVLSAIDQLELQLRRADGSPSALTGKPGTVPTGYGDSVADYYRRLSKK